MNKNEYVLKDTLFTKVINIFTSVLKGYIVSVILIFILSLVVTYTSFSETYSNIAMTVISSLGILIASLCASKKYTSLGWLHGIICGIVYNLVLYLFSIAFLSFLPAQKGVLSFVLSGALFGVIGGIIGVNLK